MVARLAPLAVVMMIVGMSVPAELGAGAGETYVVVAVSDTCGEHFPKELSDRDQYDKVADLIDAMDTEYLLAAGDLQHDFGVLEDYLKYYDSEFGRLRDITYPIPGNHDYYWDAEQYQDHNNPWSSSNGSGFLDYFSDRLEQISTDPATLEYSYYSFDIGTNWHVIALNSIIAIDYNYTEVGSPAYLQYEWLKQDLAEHPNDQFRGTIAYFHHPLFDWELPPSDMWPSLELIPIWELLDESGVDIVINGHAHNYQRWAPQDAYGNYKEDGIRQYIVGAGGYYTNNLGKPPQPTNFDWGQDKEFGVLKLTLLDDSYVFEYISISGEVLDSDEVPLH